MTLWAQWCELYLDLSHSVFSQYGYHGHEFVDDSCSGVSASWPGDVLVLRGHLVRMCSSFVWFAFLALGRAPGQEVAYYICVVCVGGGEDGGSPVREILGDFSMEGYIGSSARALIEHLHPHESSPPLSPLSPPPTDMFATYIAS